MPAEAKAGVSCDVCHQISRLTGDDGPWGEPGNGSFVVEPGRVKYGHSGDVASNRAHTGQKQDFFAKSEFCASCHTVIHPVHGLRIEHTYGEWKASVYAEKGIQCQDCHMRSVEDAAKVAATLQPVVVWGQSVVDGPKRQVFPHFFVGANANADRLAGGPHHAANGGGPLEGSRAIELETPGKVAAGEELAVDVLVHNVAAGHNIPTGVTELRQMWVELELLDQGGNVIDRFGGLDKRGEIAEPTIRFGAIAGNRDGQATFKLWEMERFLWKRTVPPKSFTRDQIHMKLPSDLSGVITVQAKLFYRSASPHVVRQIMGDELLQLRIVEMCIAKTTVSVR